MVVNSPVHTLDAYMAHRGGTHGTRLRKAKTTILTHPCNIEGCAFCDGSVKPKNSAQLCVESCDTIVLCTKSCSKRNKAILVTTCVDNRTTLYQYSAVLVITLLRAERSLAGYVLSGS